MIKILHLFPDDKFFDGVSDFFDALQNVENIYPFFAKPDYKFKYICQTSKIKRFYRYTDYTDFIRHADFDVIYLHSLRDLSLFKYFRKDVKVIWWSWGFDIYNNPSPLSSPLIDIELYKPLTKSLVSKDEHLSLAKWLKLQVVKWIVDRKIRKAVSRVDYFTPVLTNEYSMMKNVKFFKAKPFRIEKGPGFMECDRLRHIDSPGNVLIGNSFTPTNNHLDIFQRISSFKLGGQKWIIPVNYGTGYPITTGELKKLSGLNEDSTLWIEDFMPYEEYRVTIESATHAIFGHMRQQAVGNHRICITNGVKMFFYKDSVNYKYYKERGYIVYSIEDDLTEQELAIPLTYDQALHNYNIYLSISDNNTGKYEAALADIINPR